MNANGYPRVGIRIPPCLPVPELVAAAADAERLGFDTVVFPDSQLLWRDTWAVMTAAALATHTITLATEVSNVVTRDPSVIASAVRTVAELAPGRVRLGLGVGNSAVSLVGLRAATTQRLDDAVRDIRLLLDGREVRAGESAAVLQDPCGPVPVVLGVEGPRGLDLAGRVADGVVISSHSRKGLDIASISAKLRTDAAARIPGRDFQVILGRQARITEDVETAALELKPLLAYELRRFGIGSLRAEGFDITIPADPDSLSDGTDLGHARDAEQARAQAGRWVPDELAYWFARRNCLYGSPADICRQLSGLRATGVDEVTINHGKSFSLPAELLTAFGQSVLPMMRGSGWPEPREETSLA
jgi:5,10-methylenetetrahydromethanopterin reductase